MKFIPKAIAAVTLAGALTFGAGVAANAEPITPAGVSQSAVVAKSPAIKPNARYCAPVYERYIPWWGVSLVGGPPIYQYRWTTYCWNQ